MELEKLTDLKSIEFESCETMRFSIICPECKKVVTFYSNELMKIIISDDEDKK